jgi:uncharacterized membrane protein YeaQ/YmgE (transglycosylase-associated protein family)
MGILSAILIGLLVGIVAKFVTPGRDPGGFWITLLLGLGGSVVGGYLGQLIGIYRMGEPVGFIGSVIGAVVLLLIYRFFKQTGT